MKTLISYVPHGINEDHFFPLLPDHEKYDELKEFRSKLLQGKDYDFVILFNSRNIRRKSIPDTILAFKTFLDQIPKDKASKCCLVLHTQPVDDNGTDLYAVREMIFGDAGEHHVIFSQNRGDNNFMNLLYNSADAVVLLSSNEGWGLSITEGLMCGKPVIANVTGGLQDQARFRDENGDWLSFTDELSSNQFHSYHYCGDWFLPVFPSNLSLQGSPITPYIFDDRINFKEAAEQMKKLFEMSKEERERRGTLGREWVRSQESGMSAKNMCNKIIYSIDTLLEKEEERERYEIIQITPRKKRKVKYPVSR